MKSFLLAMVDKGKPRDYITGKGLPLRVFTWEDGLRYWRLKIIRRPLPLQQGFQGLNLYRTVGVEK